MRARVWGLGLVVFSVYTLCRLSHNNSLFLSGFGGHGFVVIISGICFGLSVRYESIG